MSENDKKDDSLKNKIDHKRTSQDFEPDMDSLLVTAQSSMIIEGIQYLVNKNFSSNTLETYIEAVKGVELFIKILQRNTKGYAKIQKTIEMDSDSKKVELFAFELFKKNYKEPPVSDDNKIKAYDILLQKLRSGYQKSLITGSMENSKKYCLISGGIDIDKIDRNIDSKNADFIDFIETLEKNIQTAIDILQSYNVEIAKGMKGKDVSIFIIKASEIVQYYYQKIENKNHAQYYKKLNDTYKKYFVTRD